MSNQPMSYLPTPGLTYDPDDPRYWKEDMLDLEIRRAFEICSGCRMCFKYCDSFPLLFKLLDETHDGDVHKINESEIADVMGSCFQCKLCEVQCPYTPRDNHEFQLDFPRLVHRWSAQRHREEGSDLRDKILGDPDLAGGLARASLGIANTMNRVPPHRWLMEKVLGVHRDKQLPDFASQSFEDWARQEGKLSEVPGDAEVVLFQTCFVQNNDTQLGKDTLEVLEHNGVKATCTAGLRCCGMPAWEHGDLATLRENAAKNLAELMPFVEAGAKVLVINPTCSMMLRKEYKELLTGHDRERAEKLGEAVRDTGEFLWSIRNEARFKTDFQSTPGDKVAYHAPCHLRVQAVGFKGRDLLKKIPGVKATSVMECCGHDGTYAMKTETFEASKRVGQKAFDEMKGSDAEVWVTECPLAATQFEQHAGTRALHPMTVLARAYRQDGFPTPIKPINEGEK